MKAKNYRKDAISVQGNGIDETTPVDGDALVYSTSSYAPTQVAMKTHSHAISDVTDLQTSLDTKVAYDDFYSEGIYRNAIINGNFDIWQRGTSGVYAGETGAFTADRWEIFRASWSRQSFTPGQSEVPNNPQYYIRFDTSGGTGAHILRHRIENVRTLSGGSGTLSFWARADQEITTITYIRQVFGSGGSAQVETSYVTDLTTRWQQFVFPHVFPSVAGKIIGDGNCIELHLCRFNDLDAIIDIAQVQLNAGDKALPFCPRPIAEELALCQRYCEVQDILAAQPVCVGLVDSATQVYAPLFFTQKRIIPTITLDATLFQFRQSGGTTSMCTSITPVTTGLDSTNLSIVVSGLTPGYVGYLRGWSGYPKIIIDAEL